MNQHYFIAFQLDAITKKWLTDIQSKLNQDYSLPYKIWTYEEDFHITLHFFGSLSKREIAVVADELEHFKNCGKFSLEIGMVGYFGRKERPRVLWVGVENKLELIHIYDEVSNLVDRINKTTEKRDYFPHITLAKKWASTNEAKESIEIAVNNNKEIKKIEINKMALFKINPNSNPKYEVIKMVEFK